MEDSFFGFDTSVPVSKVSKLKGVRNILYRRNEYNELQRRSQKFFLSSLYL